MSSIDNDPKEPDAQAPVEKKKTGGGGCCGGMMPGTGNRRDFMLWIGAGLNVVAALMMGIPILGYLLSHFRGESPRSWVSLGDLSQFPVGSTRMAAYQNLGSKPWDGKAADIPCWVRRTAESEFQVFAINCTHLGCPVRWFEESRLFLCPCHGGAYYENGNHAAGPPPRGLYEYQYKVEAGELHVLAGQIPTLSQPV